MSAALQRTNPPSPQRYLAAAASRQRLDIEREYCRRYFGNFVRRGWSELNHHPLVAGWYIDAICEHLEALTRFEIPNLVINIPPRFMKSMLCAVYWPAWVWTLAPDTKFLYTSYDMELSRRDSRRTRLLIRSGWYQRLWGNVFALMDDQNQVTRFDNDKHGYRIASSVGSMGQTGEGGDFVVTDDPISIMQSFSKRDLDNVITWWDEQMSSRWHDPKRFRRLIVMQRTNVNDLAGHVLEQGGYTHLCLPMEYEPSRTCYTGVRPRSRTPTAQEDTDGRYRWDPRQKEGELLCPERQGPEQVAEAKRRLVTEHAVASQLQQRPAIRGGGMIKLDWFKRYRTPPREFLQIVHSWDTANKGGQSNAWTAGGIWGVTEKGYYLLVVIRRRMDVPAVQRTVQSVAQSEQYPPSAILVEDKASGTGVIQHLQQTTTLPVLPVQPEGDKITRMDIETPAIEAGNVYLPETAPWLAEFEGEVEPFPNAPFSDQVDMMSQFLHWIRGAPSMSEDDWYLY